MSVSPPPFDPPYISAHTSGERTEYIETLGNGSTRPASQAAFGPVLDAAQTDAASMRQDAPTTSRKPETSSSTSASARLYLNVPYAEKDEAKALGARWDAAKKKWYVPQGVKPEQFARWLSQQA